MGFAEDIQRNINQAMTNISDNLNQITGKLFYGIEQDTPVLTGMLTNSWYTDTKGVFSGIVGTSADKSGSASISRIRGTLGTLPFLNKDNSVTMSNNISYAYLAEVDGWAKTTAYAMIAKNMQLVGK